jgi:hypothetical protein
MASLIHPHVPVYLAGAVAALFGYAVGYLAARARFRSRR